MVAVFASGAHRHISLETLVRHRMAIDAFIADHAVAAVAVFIAIYIVVVALSIPGALFLTISGGVLFGTLIGGSGAVSSARRSARPSSSWSPGARAAKTSCAAPGPLACKLADGFRADAFSYLLFLRLVPAFPFFLVNLVPALVGVKLPTFVAATVIGIMPATFAFAFFGSGLDSVIAAQEAAYRACLAAGRGECALKFDIGMIVTPQLLAALAALGVHRADAGRGEAAARAPRGASRRRHSPERLAGGGVADSPDTRHLRDRRRLRRAFGRGRGRRVRRAGGADRKGQDGRRLPQLRLRAVEGAARRRQARAEPRRADAVRHDAAARRDRFRQGATRTCTA